MRYHPHAVYLMHNEWSAANYKVGMSNDPNRRALEVEESYENVQPKVLATCWFATENQARKAEAIWHRRYASKRTDDQGGREWFALTQADIEEFTAWCKASKNAIEIKQWLFRDGAYAVDVFDYVGDLYRSIPKKTWQRSVDVWFRQDYIDSGLINLRHVITQNTTLPMQLIKSRQEAFA